MKPVLLAAAVSAALAAVALAVYVAALELRWQLRRTPLKEDSR